MLCFLGTVFFLQGFAFFVDGFFAITCFCLARISFYSFFASVFCMFFVFAICFCIGFGFFGLQIFFGRWVLLSFLNVFLEVFLNFF